jgi:hypothetical protein
MSRLHRAVWIGMMLLGSLLADAARAEERLISVLPPNGRAAGGDEPLALPGAADDTPPAVALGEPGAGSLVKPRGANLPRGGPIVECFQPDGPPPASVAIQLPLPRCSFPDCGNRLCSWICAGEHNPADVDDPTWARFEFLMFWFQRMNLPPLITTSTDPGDLGVLGQPTTRIVLGGGDESLPMKMGGRVTLGSWFEPTETLGFEVSFAFIENHSDWVDVFAFGNGWPLLARPFFNVLTQQQDSVIVATPDIPSFEIFQKQGRIVVEIPGNMYSLEVSGVTNYCRGPGGRIDWFYGFRYLYLSEGINIFEGVAYPSTSPEFPGLVSTVEDAFVAKNYIYMPQVGVRATNRWGRWQLESEAKVGMGWNHRAAKAVSRTITSQAGVGEVFNGAGMLVLTSNYGNYNSDNFVIVPEIGVRLRYELFDHVFLTAAYNLLFLSEVWRPNEFIDLRLNPDLFAPLVEPVIPRLPQFINKTTSFFAQGVSLGLELRY